MRRDFENVLKDDVKRLQLALYYLFPESETLPTGEFNKFTERQVKNFQKLNNLETDGLVTYELWKKIQGKKFEKFYN